MEKEKKRNCPSWNGINLDRRRFNFPRFFFFRPWEILPQNTQIKRGRSAISSRACRSVCCAFRSVAAYFIANLTGHPSLSSSSWKNKLRNILRLDTPIDNLSPRGARIGDSLFPIIYNNAPRFLPYRGGGGRERGKMARRGGEKEHGGSRWREERENVDVRTRGFRSRRRTLLLAINRKRDANRR